MSIIASGKKKKKIKWIQKSKMLILNMEEIGRQVDWLTIKQKKIITNVNLSKRNDKKQRYKKHLKKSKYKKEWMKKIINRHWKGKNSNRQYRHKEIESKNEQTDNENIKRKRKEDNFGSWETKLESPVGISNERMIGGN